MPEDQVRELVDRATPTGRFAGLLGEPRVNVLALNLALDAARASRSHVRACSRCLDDAAFEDYIAA